MELIALVTFLGLIYGSRGQLAPPDDSCGQTSFSPNPFLASYIVGGQEASSGDFPWQVGLIEYDAQGSGYLICGGSMVKKDGVIKVITAAHCLNGKKPDPSMYAVVFGMHKTTDTNGRKIVGAASITVNANYNTRTMSNDIAIIEFPSGTTVNGTFAAPICLPTQEHYHNEDSLVSGWGTTSSGGSSSSTLQYVWKPLLSRVKCEATRNGGHLDDTMLCAGVYGKDACQGDSGGPLVAYRNNKWELVGVVSWGFGCGDENAPGVYANVYYLLSWINSNL
ncbi:trypsin alpha-3-like [Mercenaria mercenaria]|uniref:trypsin alpha-3-like n=1 Tax=Mercenaria mercenaria TaxID=6596 RepID=UPI00234F1347|nr:trypsin alpha-3-like [Mercenaria mercenaria]